MNDTTYHKLEFLWKVYPKLESNRFGMAFIVDRHFSMDDTFAGAHPLHASGDCYRVID